MEEEARMGGSLTFCKIITSSAKKSTDGICLQLCSKTSTAKLSTTPDVRKKIKAEAKKL